MVAPPNTEADIKKITEGISQLEIKESMTTQGKQWMPNLLNLLVKLWLMVLRLVYRLGRQSSSKTLPRGSERC